MKRAFILLFLFLMATACQKNSYKTYSNKYSVLFSCNLQDAPFNQISSQGRFISVRKTGNTLKTVDSDGNTNTIELAANQNYLLGLAGLILGTPTFNNDDMSIWAYDLGCPVCENSMTRLTFDVKGEATCSKCGGAWNLNASGFPLNQEGSRPLFRYPVLRSGNTITVSN